MRSCLDGWHPRRSLKDEPRTCSRAQHSLKGRAGSWSRIPRRRGVQLGMAFTEPLNAPLFASWVLTVPLALSPDRSGTHGAPKGIAASVGDRSRRRSCQLFVAGADADESPRLIDGANAPSMPTPLTTGRADNGAIHPIRSTATAPSAPRQAARHSSPRAIRCSCHRLG